MLVWRVARCKMRLLVFLLVNSVIRTGASRWVGFLRSSICLPSRLPREFLAPDKTPTFEQDFQASNCSAPMRAKQMFFENLHSLKLTANAPENRPGPTKETGIPIIFFQMRAASFREGIEVGDLSFFVAWSRYGSSCLDWCTKSA